MKPTVFLRIASVLTLLHALLHTMGSVFGKPEPGAASEAAAVMRANLFIVMGMVRSYSLFYKGMSLAVGVFLVAEGVAFWLLGSLARENPRGIRPILAVFLAGYLGLAAVSWRYFVLPPVIAELLIAACLAAAIVTRGEGREG